MRSVRLARLAALAAAGGFAVALAAARRGLAGVGPGLVAVMAAATLLAAAAALLLAVRRLQRERTGRVRLGAEALLFAGLLLAGVTGFGRLAFGVEAVALLTTSEPVSLDARGNLLAASFGPWADRSALRGTLRLLEVDLRPDGSGGFLPTSVLAVGEPGVEPRRVEVGPGRRAELGALGLYQGAFGFAPRLVLKKGGRIAFDGTVHFTSRRVGDRGLVFEVEFEVEAEGLRVVAAIDLAGLDDRMKGHPAVVAEVWQGGELLGQGSLRPGSAAEMREGWSLAFAGMKMWSEIDVRNRSSFPSPLFGMALAFLGAAAWPLAAWRQW